LNDFSCPVRYSSSQSHANLKCGFQFLVDLKPCAFGCEYLIHQSLDFRALAIACFRFSKRSRPRFYLGTSATVTGGVIISLSVKVLHDFNRFAAGSAAQLWQGFLRAFFQTAIGFTDDFNCPTREFTSFEIADDSGKIFFPYHNFLNRRSSISF